jgi:hypothetical protein
MRAIKAAVGRPWRLKTCAAAALLVGLVAPVRAATVPHNVQAGLSLSPSSTTVGTTVTGKATATNITGSTISQVSMGVDIPAGLTYTGLVRPAHSTCRATFVTNHRLVYCSTSLAPHETVTLTVTVVPTAPGSYTLQSYARQTYTTNDTYATATLVVS